MTRKLYALFILIWAIWALVLVYLYFFVYYTANLEIQANVSGYKVKLFSESTAFTSEYECSDNLCYINDVAPFEYTMTLKKTGYKDLVKSIKVLPRKIQQFDVELEKQAKLTLLGDTSGPQKTSQELIQAKRDEKRFYVYFELNSNDKLTFSEVNERLTVRYNSQDEIFDIAEIDIIPKDDFYAEYIWIDGDIFIGAGNTAYIFTKASNTLHTLPFTIAVDYIKPWNNVNEYLVVTDTGVFLYNIVSKTSVYQYLFKDFVYFGSDLIGIIQKDEKEKRENFNLTESGNLIVKYSQDTKERKVLLSTPKNISRIEYIEDTVVLTIGDSEYQLENF